jgi:hypothetical protein
MARPKRMGAYNALDDLLPGGAWEPPAGPQGEPGTRPRLEPVPDPPAPPRRRTPGRPRALNALDDLLPGPSSRSEHRPAPAPRLRAARQHLGVWNPLDDLPPAPPPPGAAPAKARVSFRLPADVVDSARDAVAHLTGTPAQTTLTAIAERALRAELARLAATHNHGRPFPPRPPKPPELPAR